MKNHFLIHMSEEIFSRRINFYKAFNVIDANAGHRITVMHVENFILLYSDGHSPEMIPLVSTGLEYEKFKRQMVAGSKQLILDLFATNNAEYEVHKDRNIYRCDQAIPGFVYAAGELQMGHLDDLDEITRMSEAFSLEYDQPGEVTDMASAMLQGILQSNIYVWVSEAKICSILQVIYEDHDFPVIGNFFTNPEMRGNGYGASLVHRVTKGLLDAGHEYCMLSTDAKTPTSNRVFEKAGYKKSGDYFLVYKTK